MAKFFGNRAFLMLVCCAGAILVAVALYMLGFGSYALWAILLACFLMHVFMMREGHGCGSHGQEGDEKSARNQEREGEHIGHS